jgi:hypothetical protein
MTEGGGEPYWFSGLVSGPGSSPGHAFAGMTEEKRFLAGVSFF